MKKNILILLVVFFTIIIGYFLFMTEGKGTYKSSKMLGYSKTINEAKKRNTFIKELYYQIRTEHSKISINEGVRFFIEKGFRYGEWNAKDTDSLIETKDNFKFQLGIEYFLKKSIFKGGFRTVGKKNETNKFINIPDTITYDIYTLSPPHDSIHKVGELLLYEKKLVSQEME